MSSKQLRYERAADNTAKVKSFCQAYGIKYEMLNEGYQIRLEELVDIYVVNARWHNIKTGERGDWDSQKDLAKLMLAAIPPVNVVEIPEHKWPPPSFKPRPYQKEIIDKIESKTELPYWPRRMGSRSGVTLENGNARLVKTDGYLPPRPPLIVFDEYSEWPDYKWYRNPIKAYKWRRTMKRLLSRSDNYIMKQYNKDK